MKFRVIIESAFSGQLSAFGGQRSARGINERRYFYGNTTFGYQLSAFSGQQEEEMKEDIFLWKHHIISLARGNW